MQPQGSPVRRSTAHGCRASQATRPSCGTGFSGSIICFLCLSPLPLYTLHLHSSPFVFSAADLVPVSSAVTSCPAVSAGLEERLCGTPAAPPRPREGPSPSLICRMSWLFWMLWIISRRTSFSCSTAVAASRRASTLRSAGDRTVTGGKPRLPHLSTAQSSSGVTTIRNTSQKLLTPFYFLFCNCFPFNPLALWLPVSSPLTGHSFYLVFIDLYSFLQKKSALMYLSIFNLFISHCFFLHSAAYFIKNHQVPVSLT